VKLGRANEKAYYAGREALLQQGAIVTNPNGQKYKVLHVRGSTVTVAIVVPWYVRLWLRIRSQPKPTISAAIGAPIAVTDK
jgi:hypothetical protein